jgi:hypothetical protein
MQSLLKEIHDSISLVETSRTDSNLSKIEKAKLEETLITLTNMERTIINETNINMQSKLSASTPALTELINDMASSTEKLDELNSKLRKIINIINFVNYPPTAKLMGWASRVSTLTNVNSSS